MNTKTMNTGISGGRARLALGIALALGALGLTTASWADTRVALVDASSAATLAELRRDTLAALRAEAMDAAAESLDVPVIDCATIEVDLAGLTPALPARNRKLAEIELRLPATRGDRLAAHPAMESPDSAS
jgi:hypothetical protein